MPYRLGAIQDFRQIRFLASLAIHRIKEATLTDRTWNFEIPHEDAGMFGLPRHASGKFRICFTLRRLAAYMQRPWPDKQKKKSDGGLTLEMESGSAPGVETRVGSFGADTRILELE